MEPEEVKDRPTEFYPAILSPRFYPVRARLPSPRRNTGCGLIQNPFIRCVYRATVIVVVETFGQLKLDVAKLRRPDHMQFHSHAICNGIFSRSFSKSAMRSFNVFLCSIGSNL